jgi:hypothetical protein
VLLLGIRIYIWLVVLTREINFGLSHLVGLLPVAVYFGLSHLFGLLPVVVYFGLSHLVGLLPVAVYFELSHHVGLLPVAVFFGLSHHVGLLPVAVYFGLSHLVGLLRVAVYFQVNRTFPVIYAGYFDLSDTNGLRVWIWATFGARVAVMKISKNVWGIFLCRLNILVRYNC